MRCEEVIDKFSDSVGLRRMPVERIEGIEVSETVVMWASSYARLLLWPIKPTRMSAIEEEAKLGQTFLDQVLSAAESNTRAPIDGYLLIELPAPPPADLAPVIWRVETSTQVCRKQIIWPIEDRWGWRGILNVSLLGLPKISSTGAGAPWPNLTDQEEELSSRILEEGPNRVANSDVGSRDL